MAAIYEADQMTHNHPHFQSTTTIKVFMSIRSNGASIDMHASARSLPFIKNASWKKCLIQCTTSACSSDLHTYLECHAGMLNAGVAEGKMLEGRTTLGWRMLTDTRDSNRSLEKPAPLPRLDSTLMATCLLHHSPVPMN